MLQYLLSCVCLSFTLLLINFLAKVWWTPIRIQSKLRKQGIKGPPYRFLYGNTKEIVKMTNESMKTSMEFTHDIFPKLQPHLYVWQKLYGKNLVTWAGPKAQLTISEPHLAKEILNNKDETYGKNDSGDFGRNIFGLGLATSEGQEWVKQRKLANHAFHGENFKGMVPAMIASVEMMLERWRRHEGKEIEVYEEFKVFTSEVISRTAFGSSYLEGEKIFDMLGRMIIILSRHFYDAKIPVIGKFIKSEDDIESDKLKQDMRNSILKMVKKREEEAAIRKVDSYGNDFLEVLIKASQDPDKSKQISIDVLIDECKTFYVAGHETTASLLAWTFLLLAIDKDWQEKARKEVLESFGQGNPTPDGIARLKIVNMIVNESLRLYPPVIGVVREVEKGGAKLGKLHIPANVELLVSILELHHDPQIWGEDAHLFKPDRFVEGVAKATNNNSSAFLPFSLGPRNCVGMNFAITETKIALSMVLQRYKFTLSPNYVHSPVIRLTICPQHGLPITVQAL